MRSQVDVYPDGTITVDGRSVEAWTRQNTTAPRPGCQHAPSDNPRHRNVCRKCGRRIREA